MATLTQESIQTEVQNIQQEIGKSLGDSRGIGILVTNKEGICLWASPYMSSLLGNEVAPFYGQNWKELINSKDLKKFDTKWYDCKSGTRTESLECRLLSSSPYEKWVKINITPYPSDGCDSGEVKGFIFMFENITLSRIKDEELYLQADLLSEVNDAVIVLDLERKVKYWNSGAERIYKIKADNIIGKTLRTAFEYRWSRPEKKQKAKKELWDEGFNRSELVHLRKDGTKIHVEVSMHLNYDTSSGEQIGITSIIRDITAKKEAENDLKKTYRYIKLLLNRAEEENHYLKKGITPPQHHDFDEIITQSDAFKNVLTQIEQVAVADATVLILGETGTGKELLARAVHTHSRRKKGPLVKVNCAALPSELIESELFGHEKGAFTGATSQKVGRFELAEGGTIFLDEIGELPLELQSKLLRVLQESEFERVGGTKTVSTNVRVIAATNRDIKKTVNAGEFRTDLYYRLNVFPVKVPPLRERKEDIPLLVNYFVEKYSKAIGKTITKIPKRVMELLENYDWPGNIRELENIVERAVIITNGKTLQMGNWLDKERLTVEQNEFVTLAEKEAEYITAVLKKVNWKISGPKSASEILGMKPTTLRSRMEKLDIQRPY